MKRTALIVGAGIGGLSAGIALRQAGWKVRLFERAATPRELGFGLGMPPNAMAALRRLGIADVVVERGFIPTSGELRRMDGTVLKRAKLAPSEAPGGPLVVAVRSALYGALLEAVGLDAITFRAEVIGFTASGERVAIRTQAGDTAEGDLLVGADGVGSVIRRALHPSEPPPRPCGLIGVRGASNAVHQLGDLSAILYLAPGLESMLVRSSDTGIYWYLSVRRQLVPFDTRDPSAIVAHMSPHMDPTFRAVASNSHELRFDELVDRDPLPHWGEGAVTLLGDAAHPLLPHTGQGAAQAMVDAVSLGERLRGAANVTDALRAYERERLPKTAVLVAQGRRTARVMRTMNPFVCAIREVGLRLAPVELFLKLYVRINRRAGTDVTRAA